MTDHDHPENNDVRSWWKKTFGRSLLAALIGNFFNQERNTASIVAIMIVTTLCYAAIVMKDVSELDTISKLIFAVVGYYFGLRTANGQDENV